MGSLAASSLMVANFNRGSADDVASLKMSRALSDPCIARWVNVILRAAEIEGEQVIPNSLPWHVRAQMAIEDCT